PVRPGHVDGAEDFLERAEAVFRRRGLLRVEVPARERERAAVVVGGPLGLIRLLPRERRGVERDAVWLERRGRLERLRGVGELSGAEVLGAGEELLLGFGGLRVVLRPRRG